MKRYLAGGLLACSWLTVAGAQSMPPLNWKPVLHPVVPAKGAIQVVFAEPGPPEPWVATVLVDRNADKAQCGAGFAIVDGVWVSRMEDLPATGIEIKNSRVRLSPVAHKPLALFCRVPDGTETSFVHDNGTFVSHKGSFTVCTGSITSQTPRIFDGLLLLQRLVSEGETRCNS